MISMEERINPALALCTIYMCCNMWIDHHTQRKEDQYSRIDDMNSSNAHAILAKIPYDFNGGEIFTSVGTLHTYM
jgi:hypothetical protein